MRERNLSPADWGLPQRSRQCRISLIAFLSLQALKGCTYTNAPAFERKINVVSPQMKFCVNSSTTLDQPDLTLLSVAEACVIPVAP